MKKQRIFKILNTVTTKDEVFNNLVEVKDVKTGEEGTLLCSHGCCWPEKLIPQATWLEGCYTPDSYRESPKLALGYHPQSLTEWWVHEDQEGVKTLTIEAEIPVNIDGVTSIPFQWLGYNEIPFSFDRRLKAAWRIFSRSQMLNQDTLEEKLAKFSRAILAGRVDLPRIAGHYVYKVVPDFEDLGVSFSREGLLDLNHVEYNRGYCTVIATNEEEGYAEAEEFPFVYDEGLEVTKDVGLYAVAWDLPYERSTSDCGYTKPLIIQAKFNIFEYRYRRSFRQKDQFISDKFPVGALVINTDEYYEYGFHFAIPI